MTAFEAKVLGVVLAGGRSSRLAPLDKRWLVWRGAPLWWRTAEGLRSQCGAVAAVVEGTPAPFQHFAHVVGRDVLVVADRGAPYQGPLAGVARGLDCAAQLGFEWLLTAPCDCINVPEHFCRRLLDAESPAAYLAHGGQNWFTMGLWHTSLLTSIWQRVAAGDTSLHRAFASAGGQAVHLPVNDQWLAPVNINDIESWRRLSAAGGAYMNVVRKTAHQSGQPSDEIDG